jgi:hypothetical protein
MARDRRTRIGARAPGAESKPTPRRRIEESSARHRRGQPNPTRRCAKGRCKPGVRRRMPGAGLSNGCNGKALSDMPAFQPYWGKPAVRKDRGMVETSASPDCGGAGLTRVPTATVAGESGQPLPPLPISADIFFRKILGSFGDLVSTKYFYWAAARERKWR